MNRRIAVAAALPARSPRWRPHRHRPARPAAPDAGSGQPPRHPPRNRLLRLWPRHRVHRARARGRHRPQRLLAAGDAVPLLAGPRGRQRHAPVLQRARRLRRAVARPAERHHHSGQGFRPRLPGLQVLRRRRRLRSGAERHPARPPAATCSCSRSATVPPPLSSVAASPCTTTSTAWSVATATSPPRPGATTTSTGWRRRSTCRSGSVLTIEPGTVVIGSKGGQGTLIGLRGSQIIADGDLLEPDRLHLRVRGRHPRVGRLGWPGDERRRSRQLLGTQAGCAGEGNSGNFGGDDPASDCGTLNYVRVEFAGIRFSEQNELNGVALQGCGTRHLRREGRRSSTRRTTASRCSAAPPTPGTSWCSAPRTTTSTGSTAGSASSSTSSPSRRRHRRQQRHRGGQPRRQQRRAAALEPDHRQPDLRRQPWPRPDRARLRHAASPRHRRHHPQRHRAVLPALRPRGGQHGDRSPARRHRSPINGGMLFDNDAVGDDAGTLAYVGNAANLLQHRQPAARRTRSAWCSPTSRRFRARRRATPANAAPTPGDPFFENAPFIGGVNPHSNWTFEGWINYPDN